MNNKLNIPVILGTSRPDNRSQIVTSFVHSEALSFGLDSSLIKVGDFNLSSQSTVADLTKKWRDIVTNSDGLIIVSPEYNHGYPGELKLLLDLAYTEYNRKPIAICGVSTSPLGGARMIEQLRLVSIELQMVPIRNAVYFSLIHQSVDDRGNLTNTDFYKPKLNTLFEELTWYGEVLKNGRLRQ